MRVIRAVQERTGGITEFVPLSFIPYHTMLGRTHGIEEISDAENLKHTAVFRLALGRSITNLQASWVKMGLGAATEALRWGVNDLGGTLMEESISRMAGSQHGSRLEPEDLIGAARAAGRTPAQRTTLYEVLETYWREVALGRSGGSAEEVLGGVSLKDGGAGAVRVGDQVGEAADRHGGDARGLVADEIRGGGQLIGGCDLGRSSSRPSRSVRPRQSSSGSSPAQPIATSAWPTRQGRPKLSPTITAGRSPHAAAISARRRRAEASGSAGRSSTSSAPPAFEESMPALAQIRPLLVSTIRTRSLRTIRALSARISSTRRGSLPSGPASSAARADGSTSPRRRRRPSAFETTFWATTMTSPARIARRRPRSAHRAGRPPRSRAGRRPGGSPAARSRRPIAEPDQGRGGRRRPARVGLRGQRR